MHDGAVSLSCGSLQLPEAQVGERVSRHDTNGGLEVVTSAVRRASGNPVQPPAVAYMESPPTITIGRAGPFLKSVNISQPEQSRNREAVALQGAAVADDGLVELAAGKAPCGPV